VHRIADIYTMHLACWIRSAELLTLLIVPLVHVVSMVEPWSPVNRVVLGWTNLPTTISPAHRLSGGGACATAVDGRAHPRNLPPATRLAWKETYLLLHNRDTRPWISMYRRADSVEASYETLVRVLTERGNHKFLHIFRTLFFWFCLLTYEGRSKSFAIHYLN